GPGFIRFRLDSIMRARGGSGTPTAADTATLRTNAQSIVDLLVNPPNRRPGPPPGPTQCHDITVYPAIGLAGGACGGYGLLLDIRDAANPRRIGAVADSNFSYWHSATFNNDGTKLLFSDEWGGGGAPKCRATDKPEWGADAIFDRGPVDSTKLASGGSWSAYWYNGYIYSSEIARGLDIFELKAGPLVSQNEIDAAKLVHLDFFNTQDQPKLVWPASFAVARAYLDQLARSNSLAAPRVAARRRAQERAER